MFLFLFDVYIINCQNANKTTNIDARNYWLIFLSITFPYHLNFEWLMFCRYGNLYLLESIKIVLSFDFVKIWICTHLWWADFLIQSDHLIIRQGYTSTLSGIVDIMWTWTAPTKYVSCLFLYFSKWQSIKTF